MSGFDPKHLEAGTYAFPRPIRRVAIIGAGPSGLQDFPYPPHLHWNEPHTALYQYLLDYAAFFRLTDPALLSLDTRVELVAKQPDGGWKLTLRRVRIEEDGKLHTKWWSEDFDAVTVASGHYSAPWLPNTPGLKELFERFKAEPQRSEVVHSKSYRSPSEYQGKVVLIVGCGTSGIDINRDVAKVAKRIYHSVRAETTTNPTYQRLREIQRGAITKPNAESVSEVVRITLDDPRAHPGAVGVFELQDGRVLVDVEKVIYCTGYQESRPYLAQFHVDQPKDEELLSPDQGQGKADQAFLRSLQTHKAHRSALVTDGKWVQNLHEDVFYRLDPSLSFLGVPVGTATFSFFEFQALSIAHVYSGRALLPSLSTQASLYLSRLRTKGAGKTLHLMGEEAEVEYVRCLVHWLRSHGLEVQGHRPNFAQLRKMSVERTLDDLKGIKLGPKKVTDLEVDDTEGKQRQRERVGLQASVEKREAVA
ncbi:hypothetical protein ACQY0O_003668 [Thecaphora frezii]